MRSADFQRALASRPCARTEHFALHHVSTMPAPPVAHLSTTVDFQTGLPVDEVCRLGLVVPKRLARRAVTRNLVKRQGRHAFDRVRPVLACGDWLLRLRRCFDVARFVSAGSDPLREAIRTELDTLFATAADARPLAAKFS